MPAEQLRSSFGLDLPFHEGASIAPAAAANETDHSPANHTASHAVDRRLGVK
jgi:hypothetical protein